MQSSKILTYLLERVVLCKINNVLPNIVVTPSDPPSVHRILYLPQATKEHFKLKLEKKSPCLQFQNQTETFFKLLLLAD